MRPVRTAANIAATLAVLLGGLVLAQLPTFPPVVGRYQVYVARVIDGDTVEFYWCVPASGRLDGLNAPELHGPTAAAGLAAKAGLEKLTPPGFYLIDAMGREKYGRTLVVIQGAAGGPTVNKQLIDSGLVKPWDGKGPRP